LNFDKYREIHCRFNMEDSTVKKFLLALFSLCLTVVSGQGFPGRNFNTQPIMGYFGGNPNPFQQQSMFPNQGNPGSFGQQPGGFGNPNFGGSFPSQNQFQNFGRPNGPNQFPDNYNNGQQPHGQSSFPNNGGQEFPPAINRQPAPHPHQVNSGPGQPGFDQRNPSNVQNRPQLNPRPSKFNNGNPASGQSRPQPNQGQDNFQNPNPNPENRYPNNNNPNGQNRPQPNPRPSNNGDPSSDQNRPQPNQGQDNFPIPNPSSENRYPNNNNPNGQNVPNNAGQHPYRPSAPPEQPDYGWNNPGNTVNHQNANKNNGGQNQGPNNYAHQANNPHNNGHGPEVNYRPNTGTPNQPDRNMQTRDPPIDVRHETEKNDKTNHNLNGPNTQQKQNNNGGQALRKDSDVKKQETKAWTYYDENNTENDADLDLIELTKHRS